MSSMTLALTMIVIGVVLLAAAAPFARASVPGQGRVWELVTNVDKGGNSVGGKSPAGVASADGDHLAAGVFVPLPGSPNGAVDTMAATRGSSGWSGSWLEPQGAGNIFLGLTQAVDYADDFSKAVILTSQGIDPTDTNGVPDLYLRNPDGSFTWISHGTLPASPSQTVMAYAGRSADFTHIFFETDSQLLPDVPSGAAQLYEWDNGTLRAAGQLPDGSFNAAGSGAGSLADGPDLPIQHAVSADGTRVFFTTPNDTSSFPIADARIYVRLNGQRTIEVSAPQRSTPDPNGHQPAEYVDASQDGAKVFFMSSEELTNDDVDSSEDLYEYDVDTGKLIRVSAGSAGDATDANVEGVVGMSQDGERVYFVATGQLTPDGSTGANNLYLYDNGITRFVTQLDGNDSSDWSFASADRTSRVTPDGLHALLLSDINLTSYDSAGHVEAYLFDATAPGSGITCASCDPSGAAPQADVTLGGDLPPLERLPRNLSDDGTRVFFMTSDRLVPEDDNSSADVYEYHDGQISLVSSGTSSADSKFADASANGSDVFFDTFQQLVPADQDGVSDVYDARVGGGFPTEPTQPQCTGDACQGQTTAPPAVLTPASLSFSGAGNVRQAKEASFTVAKISRKSLKRFARSGRLSISVRIAQGGSVSATATARVHGHLRRVAHASGHRASAGVLHLHIALSRTARRLLARKHVLNVRVTILYSESSHAKHVTAKLRS